MSYKIGDSIRVVRDKYLWLSGHSDNTVFKIVESDDHSHSYVDLDKLTIEYDAIRLYPDDFVKVYDVDESPRFSINMDTNDKGQYITTGVSLGASPESYKLSNLVLSDNSNGEELGVFRPDLETRKVGKVRVELVDKGFPNALWEIAKLMTKAQEVKGYKDHDWKNLPNGLESFPAAASRHRMKHNMGEIYDDEFESENFKMLHKVNEAFNVLAELELLLLKNE